MANRKLAGLVFWFSFTSGLPTIRQEYSLLTAKQDVNRSDSVAVATFGGIRSYQNRVGTNRGNVSHEPL